MINFGLEIRNPFKHENISPINNTFKNIDVMGLSFGMTVSKYESADVLIGAEIDIGINNIINRPFITFSLLQYTVTFSIGKSVEEDEDFPTGI